MESNYESCCNKLTDHNLDLKSNNFRKICRIPLTNLPDYLLGVIFREAEELLRHTADSEQPGATPSPTHLKSFCSFLKLAHKPLSETFLPADPTLRKQQPLPVMILQYLHPSFQSALVHAQQLGLGDHLRVLAVC